MASKKSLISKTPSVIQPHPLWAIGNFLKTALDVLERVTENIGAFLLAVMTLLIFLQVVIRFRIINSTIPWTEEIALMFLVWFGMTGAALGIRKGSHIGVEFVMDLFGPKVQKALNVFVSLLMIAFAFFLLIEGVALVQGTIDVYMSASLFSRGLCVYLAVPISAILMILYSLELIVKQFVPGGNDNV